jgi:hypothetical protein
VIYALVIIGVAIYYPRGIIGWLLDRRLRRAQRARTS